MRQSPSTGDILWICMNCLAHRLKFCQIWCKREEKPRLSSSLPQQSVGFHIDWSSIQAHSWRSQSAKPEIPGSNSEDLRSSLSMIQSWPKSLQSIPDSSPGHNNLLWTSQNQIFAEYFQSTVFTHHRIFSYFHAKYKKKNISYLTKWNFPLGKSQATQITRHGRYRETVWRMTKAQPRERHLMVSHRRIEVVVGVVHVSSDIPPQKMLRIRFWIPSSVELICESCFFSCRSLTSVTFEANSQLSRLEKQGFYWREFPSVHIPRSVEVICESCFSGCKSLTWITFEANSRLSRLERQVFRWSGLRSIHIPRSVEMIDELCFSNCRSLLSVTFEANSRLSRLERQAFRDSGLCSIHFPRSVEIICESCFSNCGSLESITFDPLSNLRQIEGHAFASTALVDFVILGSVTSFSGSALVGTKLQTCSLSGISNDYSIDGTFIKDLAGRLLIRYFGDEESVVIDSSIEVICEACFSFCTSLYFVTFAPNCKICRLETSAFRWSGLHSIHIPQSVEMICESCFSGCRSLISVAFQANSKLFRLERETFLWSDLHSIDIPASIEVICESCFSSCESLAHVTFGPNSRLSRLEKAAFRWSGLHSIVLPASVEVIGELCFSSCNSLVSVTFDVNSKLTRLEKAVFQWTGLHSIVIPGSVEAIGESCFLGCSALVSVTFDPHSKLRTQLSDLLLGFPVDFGQWLRGRRGDLIAGS